MSQRLPPLNQLRAFEAAARHLSFKDAAEELHVTQAAVSHQIKALEQQLGMQLFQRITRGVRLTPEAQSYARALGAAFERMTEATLRLTQAKHSGRLKISSAPFFGNRVLLPALSRFHAAFPGISVEVDLDFGVIDFKTSDIDAALRYGDGDWPGLRCDLLHSDRITPVCAPQLVDRHSLPLAPETIAALPLATTKANDTDWPAWFTAAGRPELGAAAIAKFDNRAMSLDYAIAGNGVVLADLLIGRSEIAAGHLVRLSRISVDWTRGMYLVYPDTAFPDPRIIDFRDWLRDEIAAVDLTVGAP